MKLVFAIILLLLLIFVGGYFYNNSSGSLDNFSQCLKDKGVTFYGAFWCSHCQNQKKLFGKSTGFLPYVECSTEDGKNQLQVCLDKKITTYPTWEFSDGSRKTGELSLKELSDKTNCPLP